LLAAYDGLAREIDQENTTVKPALHLLGKFSIIVLAIFFGVILGRTRGLQGVVHAQDQQPMGASTCTAIVPNSWGEFKGGSSYGLAFQDSQGVIRFVLNPPCGGAIVNTTQQPPSAYAALEIQRK
jgi:hypothetical protein